MDIEDPEMLDIIELEKIARLIQKYERIGANAASTGATASVEQVIDVFLCDLRTLRQI